MGGRWGGANRVTLVVLVGVLEVFADRLGQERGGGLETLNHCLVCYGCEPERRRRGPLQARLLRARGLEVHDVAPVVAAADEPQVLARRVAVEEGEVVEILEQARVGVGVGPGQPRQQQPARGVGGAFYSRRTPLAALKAGCVASAFNTAIPELKTGYTYARCSIDYLEYR